MSTAWKDLERRICVALGGRRGGPIGASTSDCVNTPFAVQCKRSSRPGPPVLSKWITQARTHGKLEGKPWIVVVAGHNDRRPIVTLDFWTFAQLAQEAGRIPAPLPVSASSAAPASAASHDYRNDGASPTHARTEHAETAVELETSQAYNPPHRPRKEYPMTQAPEPPDPQHPHGTPPGQDPDFVPGEDKPGQDKPRPDQDLPDEDDNA